MTQWTSSACNLKQGYSSPKGAYDTLTKMTDSLGTSIGSMQTDKSKCKPVPAVPDKQKPKQQPNGKRH